MGSKIFITGFISSIAFFLALNLYSYSKIADPMCSFPAEFGLPFTLGSYGGFITRTHILWSGVAANMFVAITASFLVGYIADKGYKIKNKLS